MSPDSDSLAGGNGTPEQPIAGLSELEQETSEDFVLRVRRKIHRRKSASQFAAFSWNLPRVILVEMASIFGHLFTSHRSGKGQRS